MLMLRPGTTVAHAAMRALADKNCLVVWVGEEAVRRPRPLRYDPEPSKLIRRPRPGALPMYIGTARWFLVLATEGAGTRTQGLRLKRPLLYQLSYTLVEVGCRPTLGRRSAKPTARTKARASPLVRLRRIPHWPMNAANATRVDTSRATPLAKRRPRTRFIGV